MIFSPLFKRGFSLTVHPFLRGLLQYYELEIHNLNPNRVLQVIEFIAFCEGFLGVKPDFAFMESSIFH